jgi:high-affinity K+ transport system ATPase subunit B
MARNPVMFVVEIGSVLTTWRLIQDALTGRAVCSSSSRSRSGSG